MRLHFSWKQNKICSFKIRPSLHWNIGGLISSNTAVLIFGEILSTTFLAMFNHNKVQSYYSSRLKACFFIRFHLNFQFYLKLNFQKLFLRIPLQGKTLNKLVTVTWMTHVKKLVRVYPGTRRLSLQISLTIHQPKATTDSTMKTQKMRKCFEKAFLKTFPKFIGKQLCWTLF